MTHGEMASLRRGDFVREKGQVGLSFVVWENDGTRVVVLRVIYITTPEGWIWGGSPLRKISYLRQGAVVSKPSSGSYVVCDVYQDHVTAVQTREISDPQDWNIVDFISPE